MKLSAFKKSFVLILGFLIVHNGAWAQTDCAQSLRHVLHDSPRYSLGSLGATQYSTVILLGPPAAGKGTLSETLLSTDGFTHISVGAALRENIKSKTALGLQAEAYMTRGDLVPEEIIQKILIETLDKAPRNKPLIFDGSPRKLDEAKFLVKALQARQRAPVLVMLLEATDDVVIARAVKRNRGPDDAPDVVKHRLKVYREETLPAANFLRSLDTKELSFRTLNGDLTPDDVKDAALKHLNE